MRGTSPRLMAVYISLIATIAAGVVTGSEIIFRDSFRFWFLPIILGCLFCIIYFVVYYTLSEFIYEK